MKRLIVFIVVFAFFLAFIVLNLDHRCDISLGFMTFKEIPVFLSSLFSFVLGMLFAVPLIFSLGKRKKKKSESDEDGVSSSGTVKSRFGRKDKKAKTGEKNDDDYKQENSPYGID